MSSTNFVDFQTPILAAWLNDVDASVYQGQLDDGTPRAAIDKYTPLGTNAVTTTVQTKFGEVVSVFDFFTAAQITDVKARTRSLDVTTAITAANTYAKSVNKKLYFPAGFYKYTPTAVIEAMSWIGESAENTAIYADCSSYSGVVFRNTGGFWSNLTLRETSLIKTSGILYQLSASTALSAIGGAASFTAYAKSDRLWVFGGQYALDIGNMFTCEFDHCRFNQAGTGVNCTPLLAGGGYANTQNFINCEIADNNKNCNFNSSGGPALGITFTNGSIERALISTSTFVNCHGLSFRDVYQEQSVVFPTITISGCESVYCRFVISSSNCDLTIGTNTTAVIEGWRTSSRIVGGDGTNSITLLNCVAVPVASDPIGNWKYVVLINTSYRGVYYQNAAFNAGHGPFEIVNQAIASAPVVAASTLTIVDPVTQVSGVTTIQNITPPPVIAVNGGWITLIPVGLWSTNNSGNIQLATTAVIYKPLKLYYDTGTSRWYPTY